ncbi:MAG: hypothetical protein KF708_11015 [Pirellulales bacterium]|nr:hypothetical protein [Pirellulales bacterium]
MKQINEAQRRRKEFGDFQTPDDLARRVCRVLSQLGIHPATVVEPNCGIGSFILAALDEFPSLQRAVGVEINAQALDALRVRLDSHAGKGKVELCRADFFLYDWHETLRSVAQPLLVLGNPPWVTNSDLSVLQSGNLPEKANFQKLNGIDALTGKSNFDISEWMLMRLLEALDGTDSSLAMLCKTTVARRVLAYAWKRKLSFERTAIYSIDANAEFDVSVNACLFTCHLSTRGTSQDCDLYAGLDAAQPLRKMGWRDAQMVTNVAAFERWGHLLGDSPFQWRSGIKHDCSKVMELTYDEVQYRNGMGESVDLETDYLYPMFKSSDLANGKVQKTNRWMLVTQCAANEDTSLLQDAAPRTWDYLTSHAEQLDRRASSVYKKRSRFAVFGVGPYSFAPWKVAVSAFYKRPRFVVVGCQNGKPCVLDDTCYFLSFDHLDQAALIAEMLNSDVSLEFLSAFASEDAKRTITIETLRKLDLYALAGELGLQDRFSANFSAQRTLFDAAEAIVR